MRNETKRLLREFDNKTAQKQLKNIGKDFMKSLKRIKEQNNIKDGAK